MTEVKRVKEFVRDDMRVTVDRVILDSKKTPCPVCYYNRLRCGENTDRALYNVRFEKPERVSHINGIFCKDHLKTIFNIEVEENE